VIERFELSDPALQLMERVVASGVAAAMHVEPLAGHTEEMERLGSALNRIGLGMAIALDDQLHLEIGYAVYEAIYVVCKMELLPAEVRQCVPVSSPDRAAYCLRHTLERSERSCCVQRNAESRALPRWRLCKDEG
jgi:hypothetical protein